jgi:hypothetical protein
MGVYLGCLPWVLTMGVNHGCLLYARLANSAGVFHRCLLQGVYHGCLLLSPFSLLEPIVETIRDIIIESRRVWGFSLCACHRLWRNPTTWGVASEIERPRKVVNLGETGNGTSNSRNRQRVNHCHYFKLEVRMVQGVNTFFQKHHISYPMPIKIREILRYDLSKSVQYFKRR